MPGVTRQVMGDVSAISRFLRQRRGIGAGKPDNFTVVDNRVEMKALDAIALKLSLIVSGLPAVLRGHRL